MRFLFFSGIVFFIGGIVLIFTNYQNLNVERFGKVVKMKIEQIPKSCIGAKVRYFVKYSYEGEVYDKATRGDFCERHHVGELIDMKFLKGSKTILNPNESVLSNLIAFGVLSLVGIVISFLQWRKIRL